jgi:hypothetical protein
MNQTLEQLVLLLSLILLQQSRTNGVLIAQITPRGSLVAEVFFYLYKS